MKPQLQTRFGGPNDPPEEQGNCWAACLASIIEVPLEKFPVPKVISWPQYWDAVMEFLGALGYGVMRFEHLHEKQLEMTKQWPWHYIASGRSPNGDWDHCVVYFQGELVHDPRPGTGIEGPIKEIEVVVRL